VSARGRRASPWPAADARRAPPPRASAARLCSSSTRSCSARHDRAEDDEGDGQRNRQMPAHQRRQERHADEDSGDARPVRLQPHERGRRDEQHDDESEVDGPANRQEPAQTTDDHTRQRDRDHRLATVEPWPRIGGERRPSDHDQDERDERPHQRTTASSCALDARSGASLGLVTGAALTSRTYVRRPTAASPSG
jgi:hypothetical protein